MLSHYVLNIWCIKIRTKDSSKTLLSLVRILMHQTLFSPVYFFGGHHLALKSLQLHNLTNSCSSLFPYLYFGSQQLIFLSHLIWLWQLVMLKKSFWNSSKQCTGKKFVKLQLCAVWWNPTTVFYTADMLHQNRRTVGRSINMFDFVLKV